MNVPRAPTRAQAVKNVSIVTAALRAVRRHAATVNAAAMAVPACAESATKVKPAIAVFAVPASVPPIARIVPVGKTDVRVSADAVTPVAAVEVANV